jgi:hypothetical protein
MALCASVACPATAPDVARPLAPSELNGNPSYYDGKTVLVRGYVILAPEAHDLYESRELNMQLRKKFDDSRGFVDLKPYMKYCLTVGNPQILYDHESALNGKTLVFKGRFLSTYLHDNEIDLGACALRTGIVIDVDDLRARYANLLRN